MTHENDLPEGVINADPPGAFESADVADGETLERSARAVASPELAESRLAPNGPEQDAVEPDVPVESEVATQIADPDLGPDESEQS